ncbi:hypothetical protein TRICI_005011 [Trichomonascus ciferrii]|uniref:Uncharacterized protein n=1 Tax=Trichomonascus ciferrii TaxID=44093 RepID=A0A642UXD6_9ASCO|nr:hypothetical protein TRICI_005011 [Trichomonascus ciferrii]
MPIRLFKRQSSAHGENLNSGIGALPPAAAAVPVHARVGDASCSSTTTTTTPNNFCTTTTSTGASSTGSQDNTTSPELFLPVLDIHEDDSFQHTFMSSMPPHSVHKDLPAVPAYDYDDDDNSSIQPSPVIPGDGSSPQLQQPGGGNSDTLRPVVAGQNPNSVESSSSTLPTQHFSTPSSASSSITVESLVQNNSAELDLARQYWSKHHHGTGDDGDAAAVLTNQQQPQQNKDTPDLRSVPNHGYGGYGQDLDFDDDEEDDDDEPLYKTSRVKSIFPNISFYKPLNKGPAMTVDTRDIDGGSDDGESLMMPHSASSGPNNSNNRGFYDTDQNLSNLSFDRSKTEADLVSRSAEGGSDPLPASASSNTPSASSSFKKSLASPVKTIGKLTKRSSRSFSDKKKKLSFNGNNSSNSDVNSLSDQQQQQQQPPPLPSLDTSTSFHESMHQSQYYSPTEVQETTHEGHEEDVIAREAQLRRQSKSRGMNPLSMRSSLPPKDDDEDFDEGSGTDNEDDTLLPLSPLVPPDKSPENLKFPVRSQSGNMVMTKAQLDSYRKSIIEGGMTNPAADGGADNDYHNDDDDRDPNTTTTDRSNDNDYEEEDEEYDDDDDEEEGEDKRVDRYDDEADDKKQSVRMRLKQDAHLSVYRQKMSKVTGSQTAFSSYNNAGLRQTQSFANFDYLAHEYDEEDDDDEDEYDDVPLGILQAHGFPTGGGNGGRLKSMSSQPNLLKSSQTTPSVLYAGGNNNNNNNNFETQSVHSEGPLPGQRIDRQSQPPLPPVFSAGTTQMNRGLVGEIAREEEAKLRRKSIGNALGQGPLVQQSAAIRSSTMLQQPQQNAVQNSGQSTYSQSFYSAGNGSGNSNSGGSTSELQQQMMQMMQMQMQMLQQMNSNNRPKVAAQVQPAFGGPQQPRPYSSFNHYNSNRQTSSFDNPARPASIRSFSPSETSQTQPTFGHQRSGSQPGPSLKDLASQEAHKMARPQSQPLGAGQRHSQHQTSMRIVQSANMPDEEDDDDEDDEAWEEMLRKRRSLKEMWKNQSTTTTSVAI